MNSPELNNVNELIAWHLKEISCLDLKTIFDHHFSTHGKQLRPLVVLKLAECFGADPKTVVPWAATLETLHNGTLIHDDLQDGDEVRRNKATVWKEFGALQAINAGDILLLSPPMLIEQLDISEETKWKLSLIYAQSSSRIVYGQALEASLINFLGKPELSDLYYECIGAKTAELFKMCALGVGTILNLSSEETDSLAKTWFDIGIVFQIQDDLLDIYGDKGRKEVGCDLREGKVSSLIVELLNSKPELSKEISDLLKTPRDIIEEKQVNHIIELFDSEKVSQTLFKKINSYKDNIFEDNTFENNLYGYDSKGLF
ncbi:polyprenyl synthetase family protein [bacterium]|nr:polyprenyl synthetase family protein [bacterium]